MLAARHTLNIESLRKGCEEGSFGSTNLEEGTLPREIQIDESENIHFVQLLFILKERCWEANMWIPFTKYDIASWVSADKKIYLENKDCFGQKFFDGFPSQTNKFIKSYCGATGATQ